MEAYIHWNLDPVIWEWGGIKLQYYGILFVGGILLALQVLKGLFTDLGLPQKNLQLLFIYGVVGIFAGARLGHCLFYQPDYFLSHPLEIFLPIVKTAGGGYEYIGYRGLASHGGAVGLILALLLYCRRTKSNVLQILDLIAVITPLSACFIRLGNLVNSEIIGSPTRLPWAFVFERVDSIPRHPAQLYEAVAYLCIFGLNLYLWKKTSYRNYRGFFFGLTLILIFGFRFFVEFWKEKQVDFESHMMWDMGQWLSIPFIVIGGVFILWGMREKRMTNVK